jgi:hypothetical protein
MESASHEPDETPAQDAPPPTDYQVPEGADPGPPTMDYFEKGDKPTGESP